MPLNPSSNFARAADFIRKSKADGAVLAVLPEYHLLSWVPDDPKHAELAGEWQAYLTKYQELAKELAICIVPGTIVRKIKDNGGKDILVNIATFIDYTGKICGEYQKKNLWHPERMHLTSSGVAVPHIAFDTPLGRVGMVVCWDLAFPEAFRAMVRDGAQLIILPTFWMSTDCSPKGLVRNPEAEALFLNSTLTARAFENTCAVVFVNAGGKKEDGYLGLSQVAMPFIGPLKGSLLEGSAEGVGIVDVDMEILNEAEENYKVREDLAREDWHYEYGDSKSKIT
ncbi:putative nitrilase cyanide hydratase and apolipoprotein n-acyltransferase [Phaeomoniella chlamydospora]|uniref:Putative nitrilase cyanide hydratase and apolipoprotein n-acyltransferase n=1 Tax=Phaeomoniella chlamydospora TaxID=158046 RepID=A0A0G2EX39_PHACM|nr:putative nitrilase cyanide hydratase and apolipoprotein n-acyltransferase [Phaeomoniella chlamydospora]